MPYVLLRTKTGTTCFPVFEVRGRPNWRSNRRYPRTNHATRPTPEMYVYCCTAARWGYRAVAKVSGALLLHPPARATTRIKGAINNDSCVERRATAADCFSSSTSSSGPLMLSKRTLCSTTYCCCPWTYVSYCCTRKMFFDRGLWDICGVHPVNTRNTRRQTRTLLHEKKPAKNSDSKSPQWLQISGELCRYVALGAPKCNLGRKTGGFHV